MNEVKKGDTKDGKEAQFAQYMLLQYLRESHYAKTTKEILAYLLEESQTSWAEREKKSGNFKNSERKLQYWLKDLCDSPEFGKLIEREKFLHKRSQRKYRSKRMTNKKLIVPIEEACFQGLAQKFMDVVMPADLITPPMEDLFIQATSQLRKYKESMDPRRRSVNAYFNRISVVPRGLQLYQDKVPYDVLKIISRGILNKKCVKLKYKDNSEWQIYHPYGLVVREPKIYFLAVEDKEMKRRRPEGPQIRQLLCNRIKNPKETGQLNRVPDEFKTQTFINRGEMEVELPGGNQLTKHGFTLELRIFDDNDNLRQDLEEFPISNKQVIEDEPGTNNFILTAPGMRASHQLVEWILGRQHRVEVRAPNRLRKYVADRIAKMHQLYAAG